MTNRLGVELLTLLGMPPDEHARLAADLGCVAMSTALSGVPLAALGVKDFAPYPAWSLETDAALVRRFKSALRETGVRVSLAEGFRIRPDQDIRDRAAALDLMAEFGAVRVNAVGTDPDPARCDDQLAALCDMAVARGMTMTIEFAPPNAIATIDDALAAAARIGRPECRILLDSMHFFRSGATLDRLRTLHPDRIGYAQISDAPRRAPPGKSYLEEATLGRLAPGKGEFPLREFVAALPKTVTIGVEVPDVAALRAGVPARDHAKRVVDAARALGA